MKLTNLNRKPTATNAKRTEIQNPELWNFPMDYPISIIGHEGEHDALLHEVTLILAEIFPKFDAASIQIKPSKTGRFHALRTRLYLTSADEVNRLYTALDKAKTVKTVV
ncbi:MULTISPECIES: YbeD family protein [unclassified Moraxella]|uniref:YbeD family protein n=1 Tax=unclassified Moraxella TaxID=2685852 RepID=UPI00359DAB21